MARSNQRICVLNEIEAHAVEHDGFLADCRNHRHWSSKRAAKEAAAGRVRIAHPRRVDAKPAVVMLPEPKEKPAGPYLPTPSAGWIVMQVRTSSACSRA